jgi:CRISPR system Cascade subunit CasA
LTDTFNLLQQPWLPVRRKDGSAESICPADITNDIGGNPVIAVDWPRADFRVAAIEFLIGLIATACPPADDEEAWLEGWENPPTPTVLAAVLAPIAHAFDLDGPGPRFLQDLEDLSGEPKTPETLLIEAPGEDTRRKNTALLVKPDRIVRLSRPAAAMALFTLQCYAPLGGSGHLTSVRGGGPLTTLALPGIDPCPLWHLIWANVPAGSPPTTADLPLVFPWLAPTRTADRYPATTLQTADPLQVFWGMPRRIRLDFAENPDGLLCDLIGAVDQVVVTGWRQRPHGVKYSTFAPAHPLSPTRYKDAKVGWLSVHPQAGIGYRDWAAIAVNDSDRTRRARCIASWYERVGNVADAGDSRLLAAGYEMDNMKARSFTESEMWLPGNEPAVAEAVAAVACRLVAAAEIVARTLQGAVRAALLRRRKAKGDSASLAAVNEALWAATHDRFFELVRAVPADWETTFQQLAADWRNRLRTAALALFDEAAPLDPSVASFDPKRIVEAKRNLIFTLDGYGPAGTKLFAELLLPLPEIKDKP